jgi:hypothetical protein
VLSPVIMLQENQQWRCGNTPVARHGMSLALIKRKYSQPSCRVAL